MRPQARTAKVVSLLALGGRDEAALLALAAAATDGVDAHLATAIRESARERNVEPRVDSERVMVASAARFRELGIATHHFGDWPERLRHQGEEVLFVAVDGRTAGLLGIAEPRGTDGGDADVVE
jgi:Cu+-exporting ATPase